MQVTSWRQKRRFRILCRPTRCHHERVPGHDFPEAVDRGLPTQAVRGSPVREGSRAAHRSAEAGIALAIRFSVFKTIERQDSHQKRQMRRLPSLWKARPAIEMGFAPNVLKSVKLAMRKIELARGKTVRVGVATRRPSPPHRPKPAPLSIQKPAA